VNLNRLYQIVEPSGREKSSLREKGRALHQEGERSNQEKEGGKKTSEERWKGKRDANFFDSVCTLGKKKRELLSVGGGRKQKTFLRSKKNPSLGRGCPGREGRGIRRGANLPDT